jgi:signal transduction histidine kinase
MKDNGLVSRLRDAAVTVASGLELEAVLQNVVEAAATLLDARYAALGVIGEDDKLSEFVHTGFDGDPRLLRHHPPEGHGILGMLTREARPIRLRDLTEHPRSYGFPEGHPAMHSFVGVPVMVQGKAYGRLYIAEKNDRSQFTESDEELADALAATAGAAVRNALLYGATRLRERSLDAVREISGEILSGSSDERVFELIAERARELVDADLAVICVPRTLAAGVLEVRAAAGVTATPAKGSTVAVDESLAGEVMRRGRLVAAKWVPTELASAMAGGSGNTAVGVPLLVRGEPFGALTLAARHFGDEQRRLTETFANHASVMLEYTRAKEELERLLLIEERERIGRDLHDSVIQRLFATGLELQALAARYEARDSDLATRLSSAADGLDDTISQIRATIFALQPPDIEPGGTAEVSVARIHDLAASIVAESTRALGFEPDLVLAGDPGRMVPGDIAAHMLVVVREGLSNVARHAAATVALVEIEVGEALVTRVTDNGVGFVEDQASSGYGLPNMRERARAVGGEFRVAARPEGGTQLEWRVAKP